MKEGPEGKNAAAKDREEQEKRLTDRMGGIRRKIIVLSGKGGVGKSTVAANLAVSLSLAGHKVGLLDADIHGPSIPRIFNLEGRVVGSDGESITPVPYSENLLVMSIGFLLRDRDEAVIWRGPLKMGVLRQFLADVEWGALDYLVIDLPPGTGDEPLSICQLIPDADGGIVVTTPQELALADVRKCINFCRKLNLPVLGVLENMSGFICPHCGKRTDVFGEGGAETMALQMDVPFLGRVPLDPDIVRSCEADVPYVERFKDTETAQVFAAIARAAKTDENS